MNSIVRTLLVCAFGGTVCFAGCSGGGPETVPVYGTISFDGREIPKFCRLFFQPVRTESVIRPSSATAEADGSYEAKAFRGSDGLLPATYKIQVSYYDLKPGTNPDVETNWIESVYDAGELVVDADSSGIEHDIEVPPKPARATRPR